MPTAGQALRVGRSQPIFPRGERTAGYRLIELLLFFSDPRRREKFLPGACARASAPASLDQQLVELLRDPDRFAVAHALLTMRHDALKSFDANQWNGLRVTLAASGAAQYDPADMATLYVRWSSLVSRSTD